MKKLTELVLSEVSGGCASRPAPAPRGCKPPRGGGCSPAPSFLGGIFIPLPVINIPVITVQVTCPPIVIPTPCVTVSNSCTPVFTNGGC